jgi:RimJ/RimL family protein N-acetyltransferase
VIDLRPLEAGDLPRLLAWLQEPGVADALPYAQDQVSLQSLEQRLAQPDPDVRELILEHRGEPVGAARLSRRQSPRGPWGSFEVFLGPQSQGRGLGRGLLPPLQAQAQAWAGSQVVQIAAFADNERAQHLYREVLGYREVQRHWWWLGDQRRQVVLMSNQPDFFQRRPVGFSPG